MTISRGQALVLLEPKISNIWNEPWPERMIEYTKFCNIRRTSKYQVTDYKMSNFGDLVKKGEGENITYLDPLFGTTKVYTPVRFAGGYKITQEMLDHELYGQVDRFEGELKKSAKDKQETVAALIFNNGFGTTDADGFSSTGFDSLQLFSTAHTRLDGGSTQRNRPSTDADLTVTSLQNAIIDFHNWKNDRGRPFMSRPRMLVVGPEDIFTARELLQSEYKPGVANNEINALREEGLTYMVSHYKTDTDAWFLFGDTHDVNFIWDIEPRQGMEEDFDSEVIKRKIVMGFVVGHGEWRGTWGTSGG